MYFSFMVPQACLSMFAKWLPSMHEDHCFTTWTFLAQIARQSSNCTERQTWNYAILLNLNLVCHDIQNTVKDNHRQHEWKLVTWKWVNGLSLYSLQMIVEGRSWIIYDLLRGPDKCYSLVEILPIKNELKKSWFEKNTIISSPYF